MREQTVTTTDSTECQHFVNTSAICAWYCAAQTRLGALKHVPLCCVGKYRTAIRRTAHWQTQFQSMSIATAVMLSALPALKAARMTALAAASANCWPSSAELLACMTRTTHQAHVRTATTAYQSPVCQKVLYRKVHLHKID